MKVKKIFLFSALLFILVFFILLLIPQPDNTTYKEQDFYHYYTLTDPDIRNSPRISDDYYFTFVMPDEGQWIMSGIVFTGGDVSRLRRYLKELGFYLYRTESNGQEEVWLPVDDKHVEFSLWQKRKANTVSLTKTTS